MYLKLRVAVAAVVFVLCATGGYAISTAVPKDATQAFTTTLQRTRIQHEVRLVTIHVRGKVIRRHDHILVVYVPRTVFRSRTTHKRIVVPAHRVKIHEPSPTFGETSAVVGVSPLPVTVTIPVTVTVPVTVPGPTTTVPGPTTTVTLPQATTTVTVPTTITLPLSGSQ